MLTSTATLDPAFRVAPVDRRLFGSFVEHLGRCVHGGIYTPGDPRSEVDGYRLDVADLVRELGVSVVRYPGGNFVSGYRWEDGVDPVADRPRRLDRSGGLPHHHWKGSRVIVRSAFVRGHRMAGCGRAAAAVPGLSRLPDARQNRAWAGR